jgi:hypothetical protein
MQVAGASVHADRRAMASHSSRPTMGIRTKVGVAVPGTCRGDPDYVLRQGEREAAGKRRFPRSSPRRTVRSSQLGLDPSQPVGARSVNRCLTAPLSTQIRAIYSAAMRAHSAERQGGRGPGVQQRGVPSRSPPRCPVPMARRSLRSGMCMPEERGVPCVGPPIRSVARNGSGMSAGCGSRRTAGSIEAIATADDTAGISLPTATCPNTGFGRALFYSEEPQSVRAFCSPGGLHVFGRGSFAFRPQNGPRST